MLDNIKVIKHNDCAKLFGEKIKTEKFESDNANDVTYS